jgi:predicted outer membrane lipoprotein
VGHRILAVARGIETALWYQYMQSHSHLRELLNKITMKKQILVIQGGGDDGYEADKSLVASLQKEIKITT